MTLSTPVKVFALAAVAMMLGLGGFFFLVASKSSGPERIVVQHHVTHPAAVAKPTAVQHAAVKHSVRKAPAVAVDGSIPAPLRRALAHHAIVVAIVFSSSVAADRAAVAEARAGAIAAHAGFVALDVHREAVAEQVAALAGVADPAVYVARRSSKLVAVAAGAFDRATVAAAVAGAR